MNFLYKAAVIWVLSLLAAGPIPLAVHVAVCHNDEHSSHCHHHESAPSSACCDHDHASHSDSDESSVAVFSGIHDHDCGVCHTLSQTASNSSLEQLTLSQPLTIRTSVVLDGIYDAPNACGYLVRGPPC